MAGTACTDNGNHQDASEQLILEYLNYHKAMGYNVYFLYLPDLKKQNLYWFCLAPRQKPMAK